jgi:hypothetical protein
VERDVVRWLVLVTLPACLSLPPRPPENGGDAGGDAGDDAPAMPRLVFGNNTMFGIPNDVTAGTAYVASFKLPANGNVRSIVVYLDAATVGTTVEGALYGDAGGLPDVLFSRADMAIVTGSGWLRIPVASMDVNGGDTYWLGVMCPVSTCVGFRVLSMSQLQPGNCSAPPDSCVDRELNLTSGFPGMWISNTESMGSLSIYASDQ